MENPNIKYSLEGRIVEIITSMHKFQENIRSRENKEDDYKNMQKIGILKKAIMSSIERETGDKDPNFKVEDYKYMFDGEPTFEAATQTLEDIKKQLTLKYKAENLLKSLQYLNQEKSEIEADIRRKKGIENGIITSTTRNGGDLDSKKLIRGNELSKLLEKNKLVALEIAEMVNTNPGLKGKM
jgi:hypothetical protein